MFEPLLVRGFQIEFHSHSRAILAADFPEAVAELQAALGEALIPIEEIIAGGGGEAKGTQRLRRALAGRGWTKTTFVIEKRINGTPRESQSHEVDHVRATVNGLIALEIEWNNKDPFFDRDLENFKRLHADGAISVGVIVTRGRELHGGLRDMVARFIESRGITDIAGLEPWQYAPTPRQRRAIEQRVGRQPGPHAFRDAFASLFVADKFGEATTHWRKLEDRVHRGVGNPCPLLLIGLPPGIVTFGEDLAAVLALTAGSVEET